MIHKVFFVFHTIKKTVELNDQLFLLTDDHSRVLLEEIEGDKNSSYINASYIPVSDKKTTSRSTQRRNTTRQDKTVEWRRHDLFDRMDR